MKAVQIMVSPKAYRLDHILEQIAERCRYSLQRGGAVLERDGIDLTTWHVNYREEYFDPELDLIVPEHIEIVVEAPDT